MPPYRNAAIGRIVSAVVIAMTLMVVPRLARGQTFHVIYNFTGGAAGSTPQAGLSMDNAGNLYGTLAYGGSQNCRSGCGTVFRLKRSGPGWVYTTLHQFQGGDDGYQPYARVVFGPDGSLYGTTTYGGGYGCNLGGCGTVFNLQPPATFCSNAQCPWVETVLYSFGSPAVPYSEVTFDGAGNVYGTTFLGGSGCIPTGCGAVYELTLSQGGWMVSSYYAFGPDSVDLDSGVVLDQSGNLYGTTAIGGLDKGTAYQLTRSGSGWTETTLHEFQGSDGEVPIAGLVFDPFGHLYGATSDAGPAGGGTIFELTPSGDTWLFSLLYGLSGPSNSGPQEDLLLDASGNICGTTQGSGTDSQGTVFKLSFSNGSWTETVLHNFTGGADGGSPRSNVIMDTQGNLYGTAAGGGTYDSGVVWEITP